MGDLHFANRAEVRAHLRNIRKRWWNSGAIGGRDHNLLLELFKHHPRAGDKAPSGVSHFEVRRAPLGDTYSWCFYVVTPDGHSRDFSVNKALNALYAARQEQATSPVPPRKASHGS